MCQIEEMKEKDAAALSTYQDLMQYHRVRVTWKVRLPVTARLR